MTLLCNSDFRESWNQKFLDYEIETSGGVVGWWRLGSWNQKFLDYEIETIIDYLHWTLPQLSWNQKFLDYEIETRLSIQYP